MDNLDKFLETYTLPRLNHEEIKNLNRPIIRKMTESLINPHLPQPRATNEQNLRHRQLFQ